MRAMFQRLAAVLALLAMAGTVSAEDIRRIQPGDRYYLYNLTQANDLVTVLALDYERGRVKVQYPNGAVDWVAPSNLMTRSQSDAADTATHVGVGVLVLGGLYCLFNPDDCAKGNGAAASAPASLTVTLVNRHCESVDYFVDGVRVLAAVPEGGRRSFTIAPGARRVRVCNAGTATCAALETVSWRAATTITVSRGESCR